MSGSGTSSGASTKAGQALARVLGIKLQDDDENAYRYEDPVTRGESVFSTGSGEHPIEGPPTTSEWLNEQLPTRGEVVSYVKSLFPFISWLPHYNLQWLAGDVVAGITIGAVLVPQGMAYALLANLSPQFGLYSSFIGPVTYWIFGTSKDISIGPVAVLSTVVGTVVADVGGDLPPNIVATAFAVIAGSIVLGIGLLRLGWIVDLISITSLSAFMTGSAITIGASQLPSLFGITGFSNRDPAYKVIINTLKHLPDTKLDAAIGLTALFFLYLIRYTLTRAAERWPANKRIIFFLNTMRTVFVILLYTMVSWLINKDRKSHPAVRVLGNVPKGFQHGGVPEIPPGLVSKFASHLPAGIIVMLVEHIAISKSFGRVNNYTIDPSQEMVAIGMTNLLGSFLGAYPSTGSFSRTAIKSKAGVRTPAAGLITGLIVLLATYLLTAVFFYIPNAVLAAFWRVSPIEVFIFFIGVFISVFAQIEDGLYATVCISAAVLIYRILKARGRFLGKVKLVGEYGTFEERVENAARNIFLPLDHGDGSNPEVELENPYPGIFIYRFSEGFNYPSANHALEYLTGFIYARTRRTSPETYERKGDRSWSNPGPRKPGKSREDPDHGQKPTLKAIILDFSSVNNVDITSVQRLIDVRNVLDTYTAPDVVDWHVACINNRWTRRALIAGGFGTPTKSRDGIPHRWKSIFSVAEIGGKDSAAAVAEENAIKRELSIMANRPGDEEMAKATAMVEEEEEETPRPNLTSAVQSAIANVEARMEASSSG
ncbi:sulfate permease family domain-containing protein [Trichoderma breve]|uniref:Sulfate permease family domain-containing protein n=1 Tax=Trichoderma breve TaxID=2034170 RepID=A0A9W9E3T5_9HYPO|nr:sulfate permease family domain-containing protein [Trichoderma breve]KAJ4855532.1 sulfate permease family domain-containing protein [Trichoderma breve]